MTAIREDVIAALISGIGEMAGEDFSALLAAASRDEIAEATSRLTVTAANMGRPPDVLSFDLWTLVKLAGQGRCLEWVAEQLPQWRPWPGKSMSTVLKTESPETVARIRSALRSVGLAVDEGSMGEADDDAGLAGGPGT